jgi:hypothetical protein
MRTLSPKYSGKWGAVVSTKKNEKSRPKWTALSEIFRTQSLRRIGHLKGQFRLFGHQPLAFDPSPSLKFFPKSFHLAPKSRNHA